MASYALVLSCEHGGNEIPPAYAYLFEGQENVLQTHRGWDPGALAIAQNLSDKLGVPLVSCIISRLLIEMNRSLDNPDLFSEFSSALSEKEKTKLVETIYLPYRSKVEALLNTNLNHGKVSLHFSIHSFTPIFHGIIRDTDIGILFDPNRPLEVEVCHQLKVLLSKALPDMQVMFNAPYKGTDDGLTTFLRTQYPTQTYAGVEIEVNQKWIDTCQMERISTSLEKVLLSFIKRKPVIN